MHKNKIPTTIWGSNNLKYLSNISKLCKDNNITSPNLSTTRSDDTIFSFLFRRIPATVKKRSENYQSHSKLHGTALLRLYRSA